MSALRSRTYRITTTGGAGVSAGSAQLGLVGPVKLLGVFVDQPAGSPATTDVNLVDTGRTFNLVANSGTDTWVRPTEVIHTQAGVAVAATESPNRDFPILRGNGQLDIAQSNDGTFDITIVYEPIH